MYGNPPITFSFDRRIYRTCLPLLDNAITAIDPPGLAEGTRHLGRIPDPGSRGYNTAEMKRLLLAGLVALLAFQTFPTLAADKWTRVQSKSFTLGGNAIENAMREIAEDSRT